MKKIRVAIVDDHKIIREGLVSLFEGHEEIEITGNFENGAEFLNAMEPGKYDLVLLDMHMPEKGGIETAAEMIKKYPATKVLIHTMSEIIDEIEQIVRIGTHGYILKSAGQEELAVAIKLVTHGSSYYSSSVINSFIKSCTGLNGNALKELTKDEISILKQYCEDVPVSKIAGKMNVSDAQIVASVGHIKSVLNTKTDIALTKFYVTHYKELSAYL